MIRPFLAIAGCLMLVFQSFAQNILGGIILGCNQAQVDGDEVYGFYKPGLNAGATAIVPFGSNFSFFLETIFSQRGAYKKYPYSFDTTFTVSQLPYYNLRLNYLDIPFGVQYNDKDVITVGAGFTYGRLVSGKEVEHGRLVPWNSKQGPYDKDDYNVFVDTRFRLYWKIWFHFRYSYSIDHIRIRTFTANNRTWVRYQYNNFLTFRLIYVINDKPPAQKK